MNSNDVLDARTLTPENIAIRRGGFNMLDVEVKGDRVYRSVFAVQAFPISSPNTFVSLFYYDEHDKIVEIGLIEDLHIFPDETRKTIKEALGKHYYAYEVLKINAVKWEYGLLRFDVDTDKGPKKFSMRWEQHRAVDFGERGKMILDIFDDRYIVPDVDALPKLEREMFTRFVFW